MKLIATLGTTPTNFKHIYKIDDKSYEEFFSFLALKKHFDIDDKDVIIVGTKDTQNKQKEYIQNFKFIEIDADNFDDVFAKTLNIMDNDSIVDLTQSFKSLGYGAILSYNFSKSVGKRVKDIFYAQVQNNCNAGNSNCEFVFQSLKRYEEIVDLVREINIFITSWYVLNQEKEEEFKIIHNSLLNISKKLLINDLDILKHIEKIENEIKRLKDNKDYEYLHIHLEKLNEEITELKEVESEEKEFIKFIKFSRLYFNKNFLLQSLTMLFEAIGAFVEYKTKDNFVCRSQKGEFTKQDNKYNYRNCLKSKLSVVRYGKKIYYEYYQNIKINNLRIFSEHFVKVDELRNNSAHVFINGKTDEDFKSDIEKELQFFESYLLEI